MERVRAASVAHLFYRSRTLDEHVGACRHYLESIARKHGASETDRLRSAMCDAQLAQRELSQVIAMLGERIGGER